MTYAVIQHPDGRIDFAPTAQFEMESKLLGRPVRHTVLALCHSATEAGTKAAALRAEQRKNRNPEAKP